MISASIYAQEFVYYRGMVKLSVGPAIPAWDLGSKDDNLNLSSHAKMGTNISAEVAYFHNWNVGYSFVFMYTTNPINTDLLSQSYMNSSVAFTSVESESQSFRDISGFGGLIFDIPTFNNV